MPKKLPTNEESINKRINYLVNLIRENEIAITCRYDEIYRLKVEQTLPVNLTTPGIHRPRIKELRNRIRQKDISNASMSREIGQLTNMLTDLKVKHRGTEKIRRKNRVKPST